MNHGWGQAPRVPEAPAGDLARHHEQAPAPSSPNSVARSREPNPFDELRRDEDRAGPQPLTKTTYGGGCRTTRGLPIAPEIRRRTEGGGCPLQVPNLRLVEDGARALSLQTSCTTAGD